MAGKLRARAEDAHGFTVIQATGVASGRIALQAFAPARLRVLDAAGAPVANAHFRVVELNGLNDGIGRLAAWGTTIPLEQASTDAAGSASVQLPREFLEKLRFVARWRDKESRAITLGTGNEPLVLRLPE